MVGAGDEVNGRPAVTVALAAELLVVGKYPVRFAVTIRVISKPTSLGVSVYVGAVER
jgi:hypothetical protein